MPPKSHKPTNDELLAQFDDLGLDSEKTTSPQAPRKSTDELKNDPLAELEDLAAQRPVTPRLSSETRASKTPSRSSEEKVATTARKPTEAGSQSASTPAKEDDAKTTEKESASKSSGGSWWGGLLSTATATATAAMKHAEAAVKEIQKNEEAQKWAEQVKGNVGALRDLGGELRTLAMPTFTSLIQTIAPPISSHERLQIHITHDLSGYPSLDPLIYSVFSRVMSQVEGGDLMVIQRGQESSPRRSSDSYFRVSTAGWHDGPWWRTVVPGNPRNINAVAGIVEGPKLARVSAEAYANEFYSTRGGIEEAAKQATTELSESNPVRSSDIFLAIQAISQAPSKELFQSNPSSESQNSTGGVVEVADEADNEISFAVYLHDPVHGIAYHTVSQSLPQKWISWLDAPAPASVEDESGDYRNVPRVTVPEDIAEIVESGGIDPREWVAEWLEETLSLAVGVVAQRYVARRMGVGEGGNVKGKMRVEKISTVEDGAGEAARAL